MFSFSAIISGSWRVTLVVAFAFCPKIWEGAENISIDFFTVYTKLVVMALLASEDLTTAKKIAP